jgi:hypothetical protein
MASMFSQSGANYSVKYSVKLLTFVASVRRLGLS